MTTKNLPAVKEKFPPALAFDEALNILAGLSGKALAWTDEDYFAIYGYSPEQLQLFREDQEFIQATHLAVQDLKENGGSIKEKSRQQLEFYLDNYVKPMMDAPLNEVPAKDKLALMAMLGKFSGMVDESKAAAESKTSNSQSGPTFTLVLTTPTPVEPAYNIIQQEPKQ